jgi:hypothetical protein
LLTVFFLTGAALEEVLLYLQVSCTAALAFALFLPDKRSETPAQNEEEDNK